MPDEADGNAGEFDARWEVATHEDVEPPPQGMLVHLSDELVTLRRHVEVVQQDVADVVERLHALESAIVGVETTLGDRLAEYSDTVVQLGRGLTTNVSTYREGNDRTVAELRRALSDSEELLRTVLTKADDLAVEVAAVRSDLATDDSDDALDVDELRDVVRNVVEPLDARAAIDQLSSEVASLGDRVTKLAAAAAPVPASVDAAMQAEMLTALEKLRSEVERMGRSEPSKKGAADVDRDHAVVTELEAMREEIAGLKRRIALRAKPSAIDNEEFDRLADAIAHRITQAFEVVPDDQPAPAPEPVATPPAKPASRRARSARGG